MKVSVKRVLLSIFMLIACAIGTPSLFAQDDETRLTGNWGGARDQLEERGITVDLDATYVFQSVVAGGAHGPVFDAFSDEGDSGNTFSSVLDLELDTEKAGLWEGGYFNAQFEGRFGRSVVQRAGSVSAVNNDALFPNVVDDFDEEAFAITALTYTQSLSEKVSIYGGLLNTAEGDGNELAGSALSNSHFLNTALLYSLVEDASVPNVSLGAGVELEPSERVSGSFSVFGTEETAGEDPFSHGVGTTFSTEWTIAHTWRELGGAQTFGALYGINASRTDIAADPRTVIGGVLVGQPIPDTTSDTWAFYYNAHQYLQGSSEDGGWGVFVRFGFSDGNPNPVHWNAAMGLAGKGTLPSRTDDSWGVGAFYLGMSDEDLLEGLGVDDEIGGELFYNIAITPACGVTLDVQVIDSALPDVDTTWVLGMRLHVNF